jgi:hypothetical protein
VRERASEFADVFPRQLSVPPRGERDEAEWAKAYSRGIKDSYFGLIDEIKDRRAKLIASMRLDVAPPS